MGGMENMVIPDVMNDVFLPLGRYPENFLLISQLEEGQEQISVGVSHSVTHSLSQLVRIADTELDSQGLS